MSESNTSSETSAESQGGSKRLPILLGILVLGLGGLAYDRAVARPAVDEAYLKIAERSEVVNADATVTLDNAEVQELIGRAPSESFNDDNGDLVERYSWRAGLPIKTHDLYVVFKENNGKFLFHRLAKFKFESGGEVSKYDVGTPVVVDVTGDEEAMDDAEYESGGGGQAGPGGGDGGGAGGGGARAGGGGRNFDPAAMFAERDADGDGLLKGDELSERMAENLADIDSDGDGAVSEEELSARLQAMRERSGGGGGRPERPSRPEVDEGTTEVTETAESAETEE